MTAAVPILWYKMNEADASIGTDSSVSGLDMTNNGVVSYNDPVYGPVGDFSGGVVVLPAASVPSSLNFGNSRSFSYWINTTASGVAIHGIGNNNVAGGRYFTNIDATTGVLWNALFNISGLYGTTPVNTGEWFHVVNRFNDTGNVLDIYINGVLEISESKALSTRDTDFEIGGTTEYGASLDYGGYIADFRVYGETISETDITALHVTGLNDIVPATVTYLMTIVPRVLNMNISFDEITDASGYRLTYQEGTNDEVVYASNFTDRDQTILSLIPLTEYIVRLYTVENGFYTLVEEQTSTTLSNDSANYEVADFLDGTTYDLSNLENTSSTFLSPVIDSLLTTGDDVSLTLSTGQTVVAEFVNIGDTVSVETNNVILAPFDTSNDPGQEVNLTLTDATNVIVSFNESTEAVTVDGTEYNIGDRFVLDGKKATLVEY